MGQGVEDAVGVIDRLVERLVSSDIPLERGALEEAARRMLHAEAPLAMPSVATAVADELVGMGPLEPLLRDPTVADVLVNGDGDVWVERLGRLERAVVRFADADAVVAAVERMLAPLGLRLDRASPAVDARLADGSRLHAVIPPASVDGPVVAIRRFTQAVTSLDDLVERGSARKEAAALLRELVVDRSNVLVCGGTGSGKTTLLNVLSGEISSHERVVTIEDAAELRLHGHVVRLEAHPPNAEGAGEITMRALVRHALRLRPDRIVIGEVRGPEAFDLVQALSTGHDGSMATVHADGATEALWRLMTLALAGGGGVSESALRRQIWRAVDVVVAVERHHEQRRIAAISRVDDERLEELWAWS